jgi:transcriptional regulator with XRE-family HTH domain
MTQVKVDLGGKIKRLRKERELTLQKLADRMKLTPSYISRLERNLCYPALETLYDLAAFFGLDVSFFFRKDEISDEKTRVLKGRDRRAVPLFGGQARFYPYANIKYRDPSFECFTVAHPAGAEIKLPRQTGQACLLVRRGSIELTLAREVYLLRPGDSIYYSTREERSYTVVGKRPAEILVCLYPARYAK